MLHENTQAPKGRGCVTKLAIVAGVLLGAAILLALAGTLYESNARAAELAAVTAPGILVDVGGHKMHIFCSGEGQPGEPTVILEAGAGGWSAHWYAFQAEVARFVHVCSYDRAGLGWSEPGPAPRDGVQTAAELHTLLENAGVPGPYVLVGASRGGQYARLFAHAYPEEVAGIVLVDAEPEDFRDQAPGAQGATAQNQAIYTALGWVTRLGIFRMFGGDPANAPEVPCVPFAVSSLPAAMQAGYLAIEGQPHCYDALVAEEAATAVRQEQVRAAGSLDNLPLVVLAHGTAVTLPGESAAAAAAREEVWRRLQEQLAALSTAGSLVIAEQSGHNIALDQPDLVISAIREVMDRARASR